MKIDTKKCIGCGACANVCSAVEIKNQKAVIKDSSADCLKDAAEICPVNAIKSFGE